MSPFRHDGHLHDLAIEDLLDGDPGPGAGAHLDACAVCRDRLDAARRYGEEAQIPPLHAPRAVNRPFWVAGGAMAAAAAAALIAFAVWRPIDDGINVRGSGVQLRVYRDEGSVSRRLRDGDPIAAGDRLGFSVQHREGGYLMVVGLDARDEGYLCYPQESEGAVWEQAARSPRELPEAIRMDDTPGAERLIALLCDEPFGFDEAMAAARTQKTPRGCARSEITVVKP